MQHIQNILPKNLNKFIEIQKPKWIKKGYVVLQNKYLFDLTLINSAKILYEVLLAHSFDKTTCFPSYRTLRKETGFSFTTISKNLKILISHNWISLKQIKAGSVNIYTLNKY